MSLKAIMQFDEAVQTMVSHYETAADLLLHMREVIPTSFYDYAIKDELSKALSFLAYSCEHPARRKRVPVDVNDMVAKWVPLIRKLAVAHDVDEKDAASSELDEHLTPLIGAPVAQIREFYQKLVEALKADKTVPWAVWRMFEFYGSNILDKIKSEQVLELKKQLATKIAERSVQQIPLEDWLASMVGALQWRAPEVLEKIDQALDAGAKPSVRGKESCLFLKVADHEVML